MCVFNDCSKLRQPPLSSRFCKRPLAHNVKLCDRGCDGGCDGQCDGQCDGGCDGQCDGGCDSLTEGVTA